MMKNTDAQVYVDQTLRASDVIINTQAKEGQTFLMWMLLVIKHRGDIDFIRKRGGLMALSPWLETNLPIDDATAKPWGARPRSRAETRAFFDSIEAPRVFKMHAPWSEVPRSSDEAINEQVKVITVTRNRYDVPYSLYSHMRAHHPELHKFAAWPKITAHEQTFDEFLENFMWIFTDTQWANDFWKRLHANDANFLALRFEDIVRDHLGTAKKLIDFLGWPQMSDAELQEKVLPYTTIEWMSAHTRDTILRNHSVVMPEKESNFIRKTGGKVGENRKSLNDEQRAKLREPFERDCPPELVAYLFDR